MAGLYRSVLREGGPELATLLGQRAVRFHEEWFGAQADELAEILTRLLEIDPATGWALRRLSVLYTVKERWADLLALYDRSLAAIEDVGQRREVLEEAAHVAKDFVGDTDRAIGYLTERHRLSPGDGHLATQLERLLERQGRFRELHGLWAGRLPALTPAEARALRIRSASLSLEKLDDPAGALVELERVLAAGEDDESACELVERILRLAPAPVEVRRRALAALKGRYEASGRGAKVIPALLVALDFVEPAERLALHREMAERLAAAGDRAGAMDQLIVLSGLEPADDGIAERLRHLAELQGDPRPYVRGLDAAAAATENVTRRLELWLEAARIHEEALQDPRGALAYYRRAHAETAADAPTRLLASRKLAELLAAVPDAEEPAGERIAVLEALAQSLAASGSRGTRAQGRAVRGGAPGRGAPGGAAGGVRLGQAGRARRHRSGGDRRAGRPVRAGAGVGGAGGGAQAPDRRLALSRGDPRRPDAHGPGAGGRAGSAPGGHRHLERAAADLRRRRRDGERPRRALRPGGPLGGAGRLAHAGRARPTAPGWRASTAGWATSAGRSWPIPRGRRVSTPARSR